MTNGQALEQLLPAEPEWHRFTDDQLAEAIAEELRSVKEHGTIRIYCGSANPDVFDGRFLDAAREVHRSRRAVIRVITGPILTLDGDRNNAVWTLAKERVISQLLHRPTLGDHEHFRVVRTQAGYRYSVEAYPPPPLGSHEHAVAIVDEPKGGGFAESAVVFFDSTADSLTKSSDPELRYLPLRLTTDEISTLKAAAKTRDLRYDHLRPDTIRRLLGIPPA